MESFEGGIGAGRRIEADEVDLAAAVFLSVHRACGEAVRIHPAIGRLLCRCEACGVSRFYIYDADRTSESEPLEETLKEPLPESNGAA